MYICMHVKTREPILCLLRLLFTLLFWDCLSLHWTPRPGAHWLVELTSQQPLEAACLCSFPKQATASGNFFTWVLGIQTQVLMFLWKQNHFSHARHLYSKFRYLLLKSLNHSHYFQCPFHCKKGCCLPVCNVYSIGVKDSGIRAQCVHIDLPANRWWPVASSTTLKKCVFKECVFSIVKWNDNNGCELLVE